MGDLNYNLAMFRRPTSKSKPVPLTIGSEKAVEVLRNQKVAICCNKAEQRTKARFVGEVKSMRIVPRGLSFWFELVITDGTGKINGWFFGRKSISGIQPGSIVLLEGLVQLDQGEMTIANPYYEIL